MKKFKISGKSMNDFENDFLFLEDNSTGLDVVDNGQFYLCDVATSARVVTSRDDFTFSASERQEIVLKLRFGDKISESS